MRKLTNREKIVLSLGIVLLIFMILYLFVYPTLFGQRSKTMSNIKLNQERLQMIQKLNKMKPFLDDLEKKLREEAGYGSLKFKKDIADSVILKQLAQIANQSEIREIEQLDAKPEKAKRTQSATRKDPAVLRSIVDRLYLTQVNREKAGLNEVDDITEKDSSSTDESSDEETTKEGGLLMFASIPKGIPEPVRNALIDFLQSNNGKTPSEEDVGDIIKRAGIKDPNEIQRVKRRLVLYGNAVKDDKNEIFELLNRLDIFEKKSSEDKSGRYTVKMTFKSQMPQLVRLLYNIQTTSKWLKVDGMRISVADPKQTLLSVELSLTATVLYD